MKASTVYERSLRRRKANGTWLPQVPAAQVQQHVTMLRAEGMQWQQIADIAGVGVRTVKSLGAQRHVHGATAAALLGVQPAPAPLAPYLTPVLGSCRRVRALLAIGWTYAEQGRRAGMSQQKMWEIAAPFRGIIRVSTATRVSALFEELSGTPGTSLRARLLAARNGWAPPLAWDDLDNPDEEPAHPVKSAAVIDSVLVERALSGERVYLTRLERAEALRRLLEAGVSRAQAAKRLHLSGSTAAALAASLADASVSAA